MTDHEGNRKKSIWLEGFRRARGKAEGNSQLFPGPTESREPGGFFCWPREQTSLSKRQTQISLYN